jgi:hypothetical protein
MATLNEAFENYLEAQAHFKECSELLNTALYEKHKETNFSLPDKFVLGVKSRIYRIEWDKKERRFVFYTDLGDLIS